MVYFPILVENARKVLKGILKKCQFSEKPHMIWYKICSNSYQFPMIGYPSRRLVRDSEKKVNSSKNLVRFDEKYVQIHTSAQWSVILRRKPQKTSFWCIKMVIFSIISNVKTVKVKSGHFSLLFRLLFTSTITRYLNLKNVVFKIFQNIFNKFFKNRNFWIAIFEFFKK